MNPNDKLSKAVQMLREQGHSVEGRIQFDKVWWEVDRRMLVKPREMEELADGVYSLEELEQLFETRRRNELNDKGIAL